MGGTFLAFFSWVSGLVLFILRKTVLFTEVLGTTCPVALASESSVALASESSVALASESSVAGPVMFTSD